MQKCILLEKKPKHLILIKNQKKNAKEKIDMSFAGIIFFNRRIFGFADSKQTSIINNMYVKDESKPITTKIFSNDKFIITFTGTSGFSVCEDGKYKILYLKDWLKKNVPLYSSPTDLCQDLYCFLQRRNIKKFDTIYVNAGSFATDGSGIPVCHAIQITPLACTCKIEEILTPYVQCSGINEYVKFYQKNRELFYSGDVELIKTMLENAELAMDAVFDYNPAVDPWVVEEFLPGKK